MPIWQESCQRDIVILFLLKWKGAKKIWETRLTQRMITPLRYFHSLDSFCLASI
ncbi:unnamed protein product [Brassica oleracea]|uniref:(rape) hypothetical protein n=1 Tax=Brassica napus TaxID=3708 RepID=A0A816M5U3_BRANA|nr:unnamed protein product [Brassica napus]